ncbi:hypothetical protein [Rubellicoccus peritrichatus]|uniref:Nucleoside phosphorylase domain-containing protein n=1 Tax=Rubellicoccus peritrichatus TaxID=3080537 RepID=A0AAQ3LAB1_9BACT|nr:hypothetical protein [Puniceicoccus sp. CR14]WOO40270.1 hypothetical protein RZN69_16750 [Puniceicoccus sp. CR14]
MSFRQWKKVIWVIEAAHVFLNFASGERKASRHQPFTTLDVIHAEFLAINVPNMIFVTALPVEGRPLARRLRLKQMQTDVRFSVFSGENTSLAICGVGANASATATSHLLTLAGPDSIAVNLGLAGCCDKSIECGSLFLINRIIDASSGREFFPEILFRHDLPEATCVTHPKPVKDFAGEVSSELIDMEVAGFYQAASAFLPSHRILSLKVVSDHLEGNKLSLSNCESWIEASLEQVLNVVERANSVTAREVTGLSKDESTLIDRLVETWRLTATQKVQLENAVALAKWTSACFPKEQLDQALKSKPSHKHERAELLGGLLEKL